MHILHDGIEYRGEEILKDVRRGQQRIVSRPGSSQYARASGSGNSGGQRGTISNSACGLAALHCARVLFKTSLTKEEAFSPDAEGVYERTLVEALISPETSEEIAQVCSLWSRDQHLDIEDVLATPSFKNTFDVVQTRFSKATLRGLNSVLGSSPNSVGKQGPLAIIITRPPEILLCIKIETTSDTLFIIYDSHSRPHHPDGSAFIFNNSLSATAHYLAGILSVDQSLLNDPSLQWEAQLLAQFSAHFLVRNPAFVEHSKAEWSGIESAIKILELQLELASVRARLRESEDALRKAEANQEKQKADSTSFIKKWQKTSSPKTKKSSKKSSSQPKSARKHRDDDDESDAQLARALQESRDEENRRQALEHSSST